MKKYYVNLSHVGLLTLLSLAAGCAHDQFVSRTAYFSVAQVQLQAGLIPKDQQRVDKNCLFGQPLLNSSWRFGPTDLVPRDGYVLMHSATDKIPLWVSEFVVKGQLAGKLDRDDKFAPDETLKPGRRAELIDYKGSGYDRGHQAPAGDQTTDKKLKAETFYLSNMAPQVPALNQQIWRGLETHVRDWIIERGSGYIITGPMFYDPKEEDPKTANGTIKHKVIGPDGVAVPTHFYKIVVAKDASGRWQSIAFVMENRKYQKPYDFTSFIKPVEWIEQRTGINFMPELDALEQKRLEHSSSPMWN
jgi:endonuclease G